MERQTSRTAGMEHEHRHIHNHHLHVPAPVKVPEIARGEQGQDILPAEADQRDRLREEAEPPDVLKHETGGDLEAREEKDVYDKFSPARKRAILAIVSYSAFISRKSLHYV